VQEFTRREIPESVAAKTDHDNQFPNDMWKKFGDAGFLGITADEDFGGLAMGYQAHCIVLEEISRASGRLFGIHIFDPTHLLMNACIIR
jgi:isovaleryl-CoA dehydrogenase